MSFGVVVQYTFLAALLDFSRIFHGFFYTFKIQKIKGPLVPEQSKRKDDDREGKHDDE